jgi:hypothetical protein
VDSLHRLAPVELRMAPDARGYGCKERAMGVYDESTKARSSPQPDQAGASHRS